MHTQFMIHDILDGGAQLSELLIIANENGAEIPGGSHATFRVGMLDCASVFEQNYRLHCLGCGPQVWPVFLTSMNLQYESIGPTCDLVSGKKYHGAGLLFGL